MRTFGWKGYAWLFVWVGGEGLVGVGDRMGWKRAYNEASTREEEKKSGVYLFHTHASRTALLNGYSAVTYGNTQVPID